MREGSTRRDPRSVPTVRRAPEPVARDALLSLQAKVGNRAVVAALAQARSAASVKGGKTGFALGDVDSLPLVAGRFGSQMNQVTVHPVEMPKVGSAPRLTKRTVVAPKSRPSHTETGGRAVHDVVGGLGYDTRTGPTPGASGAYKWVVQWKLDKPSAKGGWIVQQVDFKVDAQEADDRDSKANSIKKAFGVKPMKKFDVQAKLNADPAALTRYWEAWPVSPGRSVTTYAEGGDLEDDTYAFPSFGPGTKGSVGSAGKAEFYEGLKLPDSFQVLNKAPAWILPITRTKPKLEGGTGSIPHTLMATWNSTKKDADDKPDETTKIKTK